jgi:hypothetical protein
MERPKRSTVKTIAGQSDRPVQTAVTQPAPPGAKTTTFVAPDLPQTEIVRRAALIRERKKAIPNETAAPSRPRASSGTVRTAKPRRGVVAAAGDTGAGNISMYPVNIVDGRLFVRSTGGELSPITIASAPAALLPGWRPLFVYAGTAPIYLLELRHADGRESTWFLDPSFERHGFDDPETLPFWELPLLRTSVARIVSRLWHQALDGRDPDLDAECAGFLRMGAAIRGRLARLCEPEFSVRVAPIDLSAARQLGARTFPVRTGAVLTIDGLWRLATSDLLVRSLDAIRNGALTWPSPVGGDTLATSGGVWLTDFLFAYRVVLGAHDTAFYVLASGHPCRVIGILFPADQIVFTIGREYHEHVEDQHAAPIEVLLSRHLCQHGDAMMDTWRGGIGAPAVLFRERLISGQLWHDLTGLEQLVRLVPTAKLPEIIGLWGGVPEIHGDTEDTFPETKGHIVRSIADERAMIAHAYAQRRLLLRIPGNYVTKSLYSRIIDAGTRDPSLDRSRVMAAEIARIGCPLVLLGVRVENRTVEDLPAFFARIIDTMLIRHGRAAIVIDGHNSARGAPAGQSLAAQSFAGQSLVGQSLTGQSLTGQPLAGQSFASKFQHLATEEPIAVERRVVQALLERYKDSPVILINNIGGSMAQSIFWCHAAHFFVTMYGSGLAKYRWACNQTGLVVTSRWTLDHKARTHIYENEYLEDARPLMFLAEQFVEDLPDSPLLITEPGNPPARWNFNVLPDGLESAVETLLSQNYHSGRARPRPHNAAPAG